MTWEAVCAQYPNQWIIFEAHQWQDEGDQRHIQDMTVVQTDCNERTLLETCGTLARQQPEAQLYPTFTGWDTPRISPPRPWIRAGIGYAQLNHSQATTPVAYTSRNPSSI